MTVVEQSTVNTVGRAVASPVSATGYTIDNAGTNRCAFARIGYNANAGMSVTSVSYGGVAMTSCGATAHNATSNAYIEWWQLVNPPTGSNTLAITVAGTIGDIYYNLIGAQNVNQITPVRAGTYQAVTGSSTAPSAVIASNTADLSVTAINSGGPAISSTNQTLDSTLDNTGAYAVASDHCTTPASSVTHTWTIGSSGQWALSGFSINGDPAGGGQWVGSGTRRAPGKPGLFDRLGMLFRKYDYTPTAVVVLTVKQRKTLGTTGNHVGGRQRRGQ